MALTDGLQQPVPVPEEERPLFRVRFASREVKFRHDPHKYEGPIRTREELAEAVQKGRMIRAEVGIARDSHYLNLRLVEEILDK